MTKSLSIGNLTIRARMYHLIKLFGVFVMAPLLIACAAPHRQNFTLPDQNAATVVGFQDVRFFADAPASELRGRDSDIFPPSHIAGRRPNYLMLSGGGAGGAFGAGLLIGWTKRGDRPDFDLVTGVSAGSLIAPFAFIGSDTDTELERILTSGIAGKMDSPKHLLSGILGQSLYSAKPLHDLISEFVDDDFLRRIADRHRTGARLFVATTNLDAQRGMVWDMGAIAASGQPGAKDLFARVLAASASIPAVFPPTMINVTANGRQFQELHADGGVTRLIYLFPETILTNPSAARLPSGPRPRIYAVVNETLAPVFGVTEDRAFSVARRAYATLVKAGVQSTLSAAYEFTVANGIDLNIAFIDQSFPSDPKIPFDPVYLNKVLSLGKSKGQTADWMKKPPVGTDLISTVPYVAPVAN